MIRARGRRTVALAMSICAPASSGDSGVISDSLDPLDPDETHEILRSLGIQEREPRIPLKPPAPEGPFSIRGEDGIDRMVRQIIQSLIVRVGSLLPVSIFLLTGAWIAPESRVDKMLLGRSSTEKELAQVQTRGYYESLRSDLLRRGTLPGLPLGSARSGPGDGSLPEAVLSRGRSVLPRTIGDGGFRLQKLVEIRPDLIEDRLNL